MSITRTGLVKDAVTNYPGRFRKKDLKLKETIQKDKNVEEDFDSPFMVSSVDKDGGILLAATMAAGNEFTFSTRKTMFEAHVNAVDGTVVNTFPTVSADGMELPVTATDGVTAWEVTTGILTTSYGAFTVGSDDKFYLEAPITIDDISDVTELWFGLRKAEAYQVDPDAYDEMACFNIGKDGDGQIEIHTILNDGATSETDTTETDWADGETKTLRIEVSKTGKCEFFIDGALPIVTANFTFDSGEIVIPFLTLTTETGDPGVSLGSFTCGKL